MTDRVHTGSLQSQRIRTAEVLNRRSEGAGESIDDAALARAGMLGQEWAQRQIWYRFAPMVYAFLRRTMGARQDAEELLQEVFLRVFGGMSTLENPSALRGFIYTFAVRLVSDEIRRYRLRSRLATRFLAPKREQLTAQVDFESRELLGRIQRVLDKMNDRCRAVFVLRRFDGLPVSEVAAGLGLSPTTVQRYLDRADRVVLRAIRRDDLLSDALATDASEDPEGDA